MTPRARKLYSFWIDPSQAEALKAIKARDGVPESEQIRRALDSWIQGKDGNVVTKTKRKRASSRRRS